MVSKIRPCNYSYITIRDALVRGSSNDKVNIFGVVEYFAKPTPCRNGNGWMFKVSLVDETCDLNSEESKLFCHLYCKNKNDIPCVSEIGQIVRFHRLKIQSYQGKPQAQSAIGFASLVFSGKQGDTLVPKTKGKSYSKADSDDKRVNELRSWCAQENIQGLVDVWSESPTPNNQEQTAVSNHTRCCDLKRNVFCNIALQVISKCVFREGAVYLQVWDGTRLSGGMEVRSIKLSSDEVERLECDRYLQQCASERGIIYDVMVYDNHAKCAEKINPGQYVKFVNIHVVTAKGEDPLSGKLELVMRGGGLQYNRKVVALDERSDKHLIQQVKAQIRKASGCLFEGNDDIVNNNQSHMNYHSLEEPICASTSKRPKNSATIVQQPSTSGQNVHPQPSTNGQYVHPQHSTSRQYVHPQPSTSRQYVHPQPSTSRQYVHPQPSTSRQYVPKRSIITTITYKSLHSVWSLNDIINKGFFGRKYRTIVQCTRVIYDPRDLTSEKFFKLCCPTCDYIIFDWYQEKTLSKLDKVRTDHGGVRYSCPCDSPSHGSAPASPQVRPLLEYTALTAFIVKDESDTEMEVLISHKNFARFFNIRVEDILRDATLFKDLQHQFDRICSSNLADTPWIDCIILKYKSYADLPTYQIVATKLNSQTK